ncbi:hypothetical protein VFPFJ_06315 [Purpureocillium lilacinum]|uniref:Uncharacterized protein n=1 Tax=Purpureocillium lilacinum TaxID=33203 RepID=A0A179HK27_PURLI|nr:hypothetical protein VFPFJ_06315 [Purpureocillium lilacinum]OAQ89901.1 hypothetical protein VFPFJ_06315 [Purpureocillium lilacinum]
MGREMPPVHMLTKNTPMRFLNNPGSSHWLPQTVPMLCHKTSCLCFRSFIATANCCSRRLVASSSTRVVWSTPSVDRKAISTSLLTFRNEASRHSAILAPADAIISSIFVERETESSENMVPLSMWRRRMLRCRADLPDPGNSLLAIVFAC